MTRNIELIYDTDCPNAEPTRERLKQALAAAGLPPTWKEWSRSDPACPAYARRFGSPTVLVNGKDVGGVAPGEGSSSCRLYASSEGPFSGVPPLESLVAALGSEPPRAGWRRAFVVLPAVGASLLPVGTCPACWPAYAGVLGSLGLGFLLSSTYLLPMTAALLGLALASLAFRAKFRRGYRPFSLGLFGAALAIAGKFALSQDPVLYVGLSFILAASIWNSWPRKVSAVGSCPACAVQATESTHAHN